MEFMPENAPIVVLGFLFTCVILLGGLVALVFTLLRKRRKQALRILEGMGVIVVLYATALLTFSMTSREKVLEPGDQKYFCEIDCHLAYSVAKVETVKTLGTPPDERSAGGRYTIVTVRTWFDERTISARRGKEMPLQPNPRTVVVLDDRGREFYPSVGGRMALERTRGNGVPLSHELRPGESYTTDLVFDLPDDVRNPRLWITDSEADPIPFLLIGHERSPLHKKIFFRLEVPSPQAGVGAKR